MSDNSDKPPPRGGGRGGPGGGRKPFDKRDGKPARPAGGKPFAARSHEKPSRAKPYAGSAGGGKRPDYNRKPRPEGAAAVNESRTGPGSERGDKPVVARSGGDKPFRPKDHAGGEGGKPFRPKPYSARGEGDKPFRPKPHAGKGGDKPFRAPPEGSKPFKPRPDGDQRPRRFERGPGPEGAEGGHAGRFVRRPQAEGGDKPFPSRPGDDKPFRPRGEGDKPYARRPEGSKPFASRPGGERSADAYGRKDRPAGASVAARAFGGAGRDAAAEPGERIAKRLARAGIASRRDAEELIAAGRVRVNGRVLTSPAVNVMPDDRIDVDNTQIPAIERTRLFLFHKPAGVVTTNRDPEGRRTVFDVLPADLPRLITIGRLDINTEGLLLLTNDGGLARVLELPATGWLRRYRVRVHGQVEESALAGLREGVAVNGVFYGAIEATLDREQGSNAWLTLGLREGKNREVRNVLGSLGLEVTRLIRISYGPFQLADLPEGHVQELKGRMLRDQLGERLIDESGANFDAEIVTPFSNRPERREAERGEPIERPRVVRDGVRGRIEEGGLVKNRKKGREKGPGRGREDALSQLTTAPCGAPKEYGKRPPRAEGDAGGLKRGKRSERPEEPRRPRSSNVWMAPGARPQGKPAGGDEGNPRAARSGAGRAGGRKTGGKGAAPRIPRGEGSRGNDRPAGPSGGGKGRPGADRRR